MTFEEDDASSSLVYAVDHAIIMHREAHFGGNFDIMLTYYRNEGRGVSQDFTIQRIEQLQHLEVHENKNLASFILSGAEMEKIAHIKEVYQKLRALYEIKNSKNQIPLLIADLILAENTEIPAAIDAVVEKKSAIVPALIELLRQEDFYDPLYPGYGQAPFLAAEALGKIGDKRAIISLFEHIGESDFYGEEAILHALHMIGQPAKDFLLRVLNASPYTFDNERAAIALVAFKGDSEVVENCLKILQRIDLQKHELFANYLILACEGVSSPQLQKELLKFAQLQSTPKILRLDIQSMLGAKSS